MEQFSDQQLLERYLSQKDEKAFEVLVARHLNLVFGTAMRCVGSEHLAEEIAQLVFLDLASKPPSFTSGTPICAWLYQVARNKSVDLVRKESKRKKRERSVEPIQTTSNEPDPWASIEPSLDAALESLNLNDRTAIILRFFESKSFREMGHALGVTEEAARKRTARSIEKLWQYFRKNGFGIHSQDLESLLAVRSTFIAPAGLALSISSAVQSLNASSLLMTALNTIPTMTYIKKTALAGILIFSAGTGIYQTRNAIRISHASEKQTAMYEEKISRLENERDAKSKKAETALQEINRLKGDLDELHRLRGEVSRYRSEMNKMRELQSQKTSIKNTADKLEHRVNTLKEQFHSQPGAWVPEMSLLSDVDWFLAVPHEIDNDAQLRYTMSKIRNIAERRLGNLISESLSAFQKETQRKFPENIQELIPFSKDSLDENLLSRWHVVSQESLQGYQMNDTEFVITQIVPIDEVFDDRQIVGPFGQAGTDFLAGTSPMMDNIYAAYKEKNNGMLPDFNALDALRSYASNDEERAALEQRILRNSVQRYQ